jgi:alditol oxidase
MIEQHTNWAGNYAYSAARLHRPQTIEQLQELIHRHDKLKALGTRHSFNSIADTSEDQISLAHFDRVLHFDAERRTVTVEAGVRYGDLCDYLHRAGYALPNLASLPHISIAGACATATHGSGDRNSSLATSVAALELVTADGELMGVSRERHGEQFAGMVVGLGALGVVTKLTLDVVPTFELRQDVYENLPLARLEESFDVLTESAYSISFFTNWRDARFNQVWLKRRVADGQTLEAAPRLFEATLASSQLHPIPGHPGEYCTQQLGIPGPWHERLPHFRMNYTPSSGEELQSEYLVPRQHAWAALAAVDRLREQVAPLVQASEVRTIAADELWMSPYYRQPCIGIHFTWIKNWQAVSQVLPLLEAALAPLNARPHWGKLFTLSPERLHGLYERLPDFQALIRRYDPQGKFRNAFLDTYIMGASR